MGTTSRFDLPYPEGTDLVIGGDDAIQALAEALADRLYPDASVTVALATSGRAVSGATAVNFTGTTSAGGFTVTSAETFTYDGTVDRFFMIAACVETDSGVGTASYESTVYLQQNGTNISASHDHVGSSAVDLNRRRVMHTLCAPVQLGPGDDITLTAYSTPAGLIGTTSIRIYPMGPKLP